jgi:small subunit ribosomal protein S4
MKRKKKNYSRPKKPFDKERITDENDIRNRFGLKNKKEIWKAEAKIAQIRKRAKELISAEQEDQKEFFDKLNKIGLNVNSIPDVLALSSESLLNRRLQTILVARNLTTTMKAARQLITHKHVEISGEIVNKPSFIVPTSLEKEIKLNLKPIEFSKMQKNEEKEQGVLISN